MTDVTTDEDGGRPADEPTVVRRDVPWLAEGVAVTLVTVLLAVLAFGVLMGFSGSRSGAGLLTVTSALLGRVGPNSLVLSLVLLVPAAWWARREPARGRIGRYVLAAFVPQVLAHVVETVVRVSAGAPWHPWLVGSSVLSVLPALGVLLASAGLVVGFVERWRVGASRDLGFVARVVEVLGPGLGLLLVVALFWQYLEVYLTFFGEVPDPTAADGARYVVTAGTCLGLVLAGLVAAALARHRGVLSLAVVALVVSVVAAAVLAVPAGRWTDAVRTPEPPRPAFEPCYSGSGECEGGG